MVKNKPTEAKVGKKSDRLLDLFQAILKYCYLYPKTIIIIFLSVFVLAAVGLQRIHLELDIYDVKNENFASSSNWFKLRHEFRDPNSLYFVWRPSNVMDSKVHCKWQKEIQNASNEEESITRVFQMYALRAPVDDNGDLLYKRLIEDPCFEDIRSTSLTSIQKSYLGPIVLDHSRTTFLSEVSFESMDQSDVAPIHEIERISKDLLVKNKAIDPKGEIQILGLLVIE